MKNALIITAVAATTGFAAVGAEARSSSPAEYQGYATCVDAVDRDSNGLVPSRQYYMEKEGNTTQYFINATRWENGVRDTVRINCTTRLRGHKLVSASVETGTFTYLPKTGQVELAQK